MHKPSPLHYRHSYQESSIQNVGDHSFVQPLATPQEALDKLSDRAPITQLERRCRTEREPEKPNKKKRQIYLEEKKNLLITNNVLNFQITKLQTKTVCKCLLANQIRFFVYVCSLFKVMIYE